MQVKMAISACIDNEAARSHRDRIACAIGYRHKWRNGQSEAMRSVAGPRRCDPGPFRYVALCGQSMSTPINSANSSIVRSNLFIAASMASGLVRSTPAFFSRSSGGSLQPPSSIDR